MLAKNLASVFCGCISYAPAACTSFDATRLLFLLLLNKLSWFLSREVFSTPLLEGSTAMFVRGILC